MCTATLFPVNTNICITFIQRRPNVFNVGPMLYKLYRNVLCLLGLSAISTADAFYRLSRVKSMYISVTISGRTFPLSLSAVSEAELLAAHKEMRSGGHWGPLTCQSQWKVAIVVPFRDRDLHLRIWLANILKFLQRQNIQFTIFVIEQVSRISLNNIMLHLCPVS